MARLSPGTVKAALRPPLATVTWPFVAPLRRTIERGRDGRPLLPGITALVGARNEGYTIEPVLRSLTALVDQIVCVDNGSDDGTLEQMEAFRDEWKDRIAVDVISMPGALLVECREAGLDATRHQWHLLWAGDMVVQTSGPASVVPLRRKILGDSRPRTVQMTRTNIVGDLRHTFRNGPVIDEGEPFLVRFGRGIKYREYGRFDSFRAPLYHKQVKEPGHHIFHLGGLKSDANLIHRFHYFTWRETVNREGDAIDPALRDFETFKSRRNIELFGTDDPRSVKFRYQRQAAYHLAAYDPDEYGQYPEALNELLAGPQRFEVVYRDGRPWTRIDHEDAEMAGYEPTPEDLAWDPTTFLRRFLGPDELRGLGVEPG